MPTYEYVCNKCDHTFERRQGFSEEPLKRCPECRGKVQRVINGGLGPVLTGSRSRREGGGPEGCASGTCPMRAECAERACEQH